LCDFRTEINKLLEGADAVEVGCIEGALEYYERSTQNITIECLRKWESQLARFSFVPM
jgi:hypothetical protein